MILKTSKKSTKTRKLHFRERKSCDKTNNKTNTNKAWKEDSTESI